MIESDDRDQMAWVHYCVEDRATCTHTISGRLKRVERHPEEPRRRGASVRDMDKFMVCEPRGEDTLDTGTAFIMGLLIGSSTIASAGMLWWVFA